MFEDALGPLDLVRHTALKELTKQPSPDIKALTRDLEEIIQNAADIINSDKKEEFLYKNPYGWQKNCMQNREPTNHKADEDSSEDSYVNSSSSETSVKSLEPWPLLKDFDYHSVLRQITQFIESWELSRATKFVLIPQEEAIQMPPFGERYLVEVHFSKPTPKCPNPLAVAKVFFHINVCQLLPQDYPINVTYTFEGYNSRFYVLGPRQMKSHRFQRYFIDTILHMKLAFYTQLEKFCRLENQE
ncbi:uncharacterized protein LOC142229581 [Haematobia irritans]|uniref:uncharacterized protein LOC142229581 n=1 Tax=Haematobia irritans TaxID=7368 RepID=UPI003F5091F1